MENENEKPLSTLLTPEEEDFLQTIGRDYDKARWIKLSGVFMLLLGIGIGSSPYVAGADEVFLIVGLFFACVGILTLRDIARTQKLYEILKKFLPSNTES